MPENLSIAIVTAASTSLVAIVALIQNSKRIDRIEHQLDLIHADLKEFYRDLTKVKEKLGI